VPSISPTQDDIYSVLRSFLVTILPADTDIIQGQVNRVPEPSGNDFVVMTAIRRERIETNIDGVNGLVFVASISGTTMTVTQMLTPSSFGIGIGFAIGVTPIGDYGPGLTIGYPVTGTGVADGTIITALGTGTGGEGTYTISPSQTVTSETMSSGLGTFLQPTKVTIQLDVHGPNSADNAQVISTLMRDDFAVQQFAQFSSEAGIAIGFAIGLSAIGIGSAVDPIVPLYADDPRQMPFINAEQQYEWRWVIEALIQANQVVTVPQPFATSAQVGIVSVDAAYPARSN